MYHIKLSDKQFDGLETGTRRELMRQLMLVDTPRYLYALGADDRRDLWILSRFDRQECIGPNKWLPDYKPEVVDEWR